MIVEVSELGNRPILQTPARRFAPQAIKQIGRMLSTAEWADKAFVFIDWENVTQQQPDSVARPVLYLQVVKAVPQKGGTFTAENRFDVDDLFGADNVTPTMLVDIIHDFEEAVTKAVRGD